MHNVIDKFAVVSFVCRFSLAVDIEWDTFSTNATEMTRTLTIDTSKQKQCGYVMRSHIESDQMFSKFRRK